MALTKFVPSLLVAALAVAVTTAPAKAQSGSANANIVIEDVNLTGLAFDAVNKVITATGGTVSGTIAGLPFTTDITNFELELVPGGAAGQDCSILNLQLAPIDIDLLGLHVDTSDICLDVTAIRGGGLLGNLLCGLAGNLGDGLLGGGDISQLLGQLTGLLEDLLNGAANDQQAEPAQNGGGEDICDGECEILNLAVGPVDLTLLGLNVLLDDCDGGPVRVCVSATAGQGLLGNLLCGLADGNLLGGLDLGLLEDLIGALDDILDLNLNNGQLRRLTNQVGRLLNDGVMSNGELNKLEKTVNQIARMPAKGGGGR